MKKASDHCRLDYPRVVGYKDVDTGRHCPPRRQWLPGGRGGVGGGGGVGGAGGGGCGVLAAGGTAGNSRGTFAK